MAVRLLYHSLRKWGVGQQATTFQTLRRLHAASASSCCHHGLSTSFLNNNTALATPVIKSHHRRRCHNSPPSKLPNSLDLDSYKDATFTRFYRLPSIVFVRLISKLKIYQTGLTFVSIPLVTVMHSMDLVTVYNVYATVGINLFACTMLYLINGFTKRMIGTVSVSDDHQVACISHMNFWGNRMNTHVPVELIMPLTDGPGKLSDIYFRVLFYDTDQYFYMCLKYGVVENVELFQKVMGHVKL